MTDSKLTPEPKPLNTTQMRALEKLIKNDYQTLENELRQARDDERAAAEERIRTEWAAKYGTDGARIKKSAEDAYRRMNTTLSRLRSEASLAGMVADGLYSRDCPNVSVRSAAMDAAIRDAKDKIQAQYVRAVQDVRRNQLNAERRILRASIDSASEALMDSLPTGAQVLALGAMKEEA